MSGDLEKRALAAVREYLDGQGTLDVSLPELVSAHDHIVRVGFAQDGPAREHNYLLAVEQACAGVDADAVLCSWAADQIEAGRSLPEPIAAYVAARLRGAPAPKERRRNDPAHKAVLNHHMARAVRLVVDMGLPARSREQSGVCAINLVRDALAERGVRTTRDAVRRAWEQFR